MAVTALAAELRAAGRDIIGLGSGEPDFDTPQHIKDAAIEAINAGQTKYTQVDGTPELKQAIINKFQRDNELTYAPDQILVSSGGKHSCFNICMAILNDGDECIIPAPYWVSYPDMVLLAGGKPVTVLAGIDQGFRITPEQLEAAITDRTRLMFFNSPSNPTGAAYTRAELESLGDVLRKHPKVVIATDDMYEHIYWADEPFASFAQVCPDLYDRTVTLNGVSCVEGAGTFYTFPDISAAMEAKGCSEDTQFSELLLNEAEVAIVPGSAFGAPGYTRFSFATSMDVLEEAIRRIGELLG